MFLVCFFYIAIDKCYSVRFTSYEPLEQNVIYIVLKYMYMHIYFTRPHPQQ